MLANQVGFRSRSGWFWAIAVIGSLGLAVGCTPSSVETAPEQNKPVETVAPSDDAAGDPGSAVGAATGQDTDSAVGDQGAAGDVAAESGASTTPPGDPATESLFETPVRIKAGGEFVSVESPGYACPTMGDVDGDGVADLVVGQFADGNLLFCRNVSGPGETPNFAAAQWLEAKGERIVVPGVW